MLDFDIHYPYPTLFLERYQRIFGLDNMTNRRGPILDKLARMYCRQFIKNQSFLEYKPSVVAAAALMAAVNLCESSISKELKLPHGKKLLDNAYYI